MQSCYYALLSVRSSLWIKIIKNTWEISFTHRKYHLPYHFCIDGNNEAVRWEVYFIFQTASITACVRFLRTFMSVVPLIYSCLTFVQSQKLETLKTISWLYPETCSGTSTVKNDYMSIRENQVWKRAGRYVFSQSWCCQHPSGRIPFGPIPFSPDDKNLTVRRELRKCGGSYDVAGRRQRRPCQVHPLRSCSAPSICWMRCWS